MLAHEFCISRVGHGEVGRVTHIVLCLPAYGAVHKAAARLACEGAMVGTGYEPIFVLAAMDGLRKHYSHF